MIHAYIGDGKGKSTAATGLLIRAFGAKKKVALVLFDKGNASYVHNELVTLDRLAIEYFTTGIERMKPDGSFRMGVNEDDIDEAKRGIEIAKSLIKSNKYDLIVLDELLTAVEYNMLEAETALSLIDTVTDKLELVLTGRCSNQNLLDRADLITEMVKHKHYFDKGVEARPGIEY